MRDAPIADDPFGGSQQERLISPRLAWTALLSWGFGMVVLLLVIAPTEAIPKLVGRSSQPISAAGYGPLVAIFAILAVVVGAMGLLWLWSAMGSQYRADDDPGLGS